LISTTPPTIPQTVLKDTLVNDYLVDDYVLNDYLVADYAVNDHLVADYAVAVFREVMRVAQIARQGFDADDIAAIVAEEVLNNSASIMARYPNPALYARQRARHAGISFDRTQRAQRGEGVRLRRDADGALQPHRRYLSGNATGANSPDELFSFAIDALIEFEAAADDRLLISAMLGSQSLGLSADELNEVWLIDGCGYAVQEVAAMRRQRRETVSRRLSNTRQRLKDHRQ